MPTRKATPLHNKILIGLLAGAATGAVCQLTLGKSNPNLVWVATNLAKPTGDVFLTLIFMVVVPLLFSALVLGVCELGDAAKVGKIGFLSLLMTILLSGTAVGIGILGVNLVAPGKHLSEAQRTELIATYSDQKQGAKSIEAAKKEPEDPPVLGIIPKNPFKEMNRALEGGLLPFMFFALVFGVALASVEPEKALPLKAVLEALFATTQRMIEFAMRLAPYGVFALIFRTTATLGFDLFRAVGLYVALVLVALALHLFGVYSLVLRFIAKRDPALFFRQIWLVILTAFSTSSSNATLPAAMKAAQEDVGLPRNISSFVLTVGATANQNGTALFEGITILFLCQLFGIDLSLAQQFTVMGLAIAAGIGTAGIPGGAWPMIATVLATLGVPAEAIGIVFGIDRILDMSRTVVNVVGDITIAACVSRLFGTAEDIRNDQLELSEA
ncbi:MAG: dicarboxylate/amino acid:cation symporter [Fimbriimonas sp.]